VLQPEAALSDELLIEELDEERRDAIDGVEAGLRKGEISHTHEDWNLPKQYTAAEQYMNVERICDFGVETIEGERIYLSDTAQRLLRFVAKVKLRYYEYRGGLDPGDLERPEALGRWGDRRTWQRAYAEILELELLSVERAYGSTRGRILDVQLAGEIMKIARRPRPAIKVGFYEPESYPLVVHTAEDAEKSALRATRLSQHLSKRAETCEYPLPPSSSSPPPRAGWPPRPPETEEEEALRTAPQNGAAPAPVATAASLPDGHGRQPVAAAVAPSNGDKRPRQPKGADSLELFGSPPSSPSPPAAPRLPEWWRRLLARFDRAGPAPPN
jgi:hypothetical protein